MKKFQLEGLGLVPEIMVSLSGMGTGNTSVSASPDFLPKENVIQGSVILCQDVLAGSFSSTHTSQTPDPRILICAPGQKGRQGEASVKLEDVSNFGRHK